MTEKHMLTISETEELLKGEAADMLSECFPIRSEKSRRFLFREDALRCLGGGILINSVLGIGESDLIYGRYGKPYIKDGTDADAAYFNISHSGDCIIMATSGNPVGIDIEKTDPRHLDIAEHVFADDEFHWMMEMTDTAACGKSVGGNPTEKMLERFYILWTMKESLMKATGLGMNLSPVSFSVMDGIRDGLLLHEGLRYEMKSEKMGEYLIAVCRRV